MNLLIPYSRLVLSSLLLTSLSLSSGKPPRTPVTYDQFIQSFPGVHQVPNPELMDQIGGGFPALKGNPAYENTCGIRISRALYLLGFKLPSKGYNTLIGGHGERYIFRALELKRYLAQSALGEPAKYNGLPPEINGKRGILVFDVNFLGNDGRVISTGHIDLWNGEACVFQGCSTYFNYHGKVVPVYFWQLP